MRRAVVIVVAVVLVLLVAGGSFYGGMAYERSRQSSLQARFFAERGFPAGGSLPQGTPAAPGMFGGGQLPAGMGRAANGTIKSVDGSTLLLSTAQDVTTVLLEDDTQILRTVAGTPGDLKQGLRVMVTGERDQDGVLHAATIQILPDQQASTP